MKSESPSSGKLYAMLKANTVQIEFHLIKEKKNRMGQGYFS